MSPMDQLTTEICIDQNSSLLAHWSIICTEQQLTAIHITSAVDVDDNSLFSFSAQLLVQHLPSNIAATVPLRQTSLLADETLLLKN